jgi:hypothetical protein
MLVVGGAPAIAAVRASVAILERGAPRRADARILEEPFAPEEWLECPAVLHAR